MVGARGFEPPTPRSRTVCATRLRYAPRKARTRKIARRSLGREASIGEDGAFPAPRPRSRRCRCAVSTRVAGARELPVAREYDGVDLPDGTSLPEDVPPAPKGLPQRFRGRAPSRRTRRRACAGGEGAAPPPRPEALSAGARRRTCRTVVGIVDPPGEPTTRIGRPSFLHDRRAPSKRGAAPRAAPRSRSPGRGRRGSGRRGRRRSRPSRCSGGRRRPGRWRRSRRSRSASS